MLFRTKFQGRQPGISLAVVPIDIPASALHTGTVLGLSAGVVRYLFKLVLIELQRRGGVRVIALWTIGGYTVVGVLIIGLAAWLSSLPR